MSDQSNIRPFKTYDGSSGGPPPPSDPQIEVLKERLVSMEARFERVESRLEGIDTRLRGVETKLAEIGGKLDLIAGKLPTWWQAPTSAAGLLTLLLGALALASHFGLLR
jgi:hypothetical protein